MCADMFKRLAWRFSFCLRGKTRRRFAFVLLFGIASILFIFHLQFKSNEFKNEYFVGADKCPACYGTSFCQRFRREEFTFSSYSKVRLLDIINVKNVFFGMHLNYRPVVFKRLASNEELAKFDEDICKQTSQPKDCDVSVHIAKTEYAEILYSETLNIQHVQGLSDLVRCPSKRLLERIYSKYEERQPDGFLSKHDKLALITTLALNSEPILIQTFPKLDHWPFPQYIGACGRFVIEDRIDKPLNQFLTTSWETRLALAEQIFQIAQKLTDNDSGFALYPTDITFHNFAVTDDEEVLIIDAENIIVVDRQQIKKDAAAGWDTKHQSTEGDCDERADCLVFSPDDLCTRYYTDHNYYAFCHGLFGQQDENYKYGLLHSMPSDLPERSRLMYLLDECIKPSEQFARYEVFPLLLAQVEKLNRYYEEGKL